MKTKLGMSRRSTGGAMRGAKTFRKNLTEHITFLPAAEIGMRV
jgi:hypothetical protein